MRLRRLVVVMMMMTIVGAFAACSGRRESVTGAYGQGLLSGQVILTGASSSPAGVEVSVRGTGMTVTLADDGAFVFAGVPEGAQLDFRRASDGIDASLRVDESSGRVVVEIEGNAARKSSSRRRSMGRGKERVYEFEGVIRTSAADSIVVFTEKSEEVTIALGASTIIRKGNQRLTAADLVVDTRVHVKALKSGEAYTAIEVKVQEDDDDDDRPAATREYKGTVSSAAANQLVVLVQGQSVTFALTPQTVIANGKTPILATALQPGWVVEVKATESADGTKTATRVKVEDDGTDDDGPAAVREYEGIVRSAAANQLVVFTSHGEEVTFVLTPDTVIRKGNTPIAPADIQVGWRVHVKATDNPDGTKTATRVTVQNHDDDDDNEVELEGTVASVAASSLVVTTSTGGVTVQTTSSTQIRRRGRKITLAEVTVGSRVEVEGRRIDATTVEAKKITVED